VLNLPVFERDAEAFSSALNRERYHYLAGLTPTLPLTALYADFRHLFNEDTFGELLEAEVEPRPKRLLLAFTGTHFLESRASAYTEQLAAQESALQVVWDDQGLPYRSVGVRIANEPDARRRHALDASRRAALATLNPLREERHRTLLESVHALGQSSYVAFYDQLHELSLADLTKAAQHFLAATERVYFDALDELLGTIGLARADAQPCDLAWLFRGRPFDAQFGARALLPTLYRTLRVLGVDLQEQPNIVLDTEPRPLKHPGAHCVPLAIPEEIRVVLLPGGGHQDYAALFQALGVAEYYAHRERTSRFAQRWLGDCSVPESYGLLLQHLLTDSRWLREYLGFAQPVDYCRIAFFERLYQVRRCATQLLYEQELHRAEDYEALAQRYVELFTRHLGIEHAPEPFLAEAEDGLYTAHRLRAWIFEAQHRRYLQKEYDEEWFRLPRVGRFLRDLWRESHQHSVEELARFMGYSGLDLRPLTDELLASVG